jgi:hypothetical protein
VQFSHECSRSTTIIINCGFCVGTVVWQACWSNRQQNTLYVLDCMARAGVRINLLVHVAIL